MKVRDIAKNNGFDADAFERFCNSEKSIEVKGTFSSAIADSDVSRVVEMFKKEQVRLQEEKEQKAKAEEERRLAVQRAEEEKQRAEEEKQRALANMLITSGFNFDGYKIVRYSGYISGDDVVQIPRETKFFGGTSTSTAVGEELTNALVRIRRQALKELKEAAYDLGCNAVIGVDFDYITLEPETSNISGNTVYLPFVFCVTANGNAVVIEKE